MNDGTGNGVPSFDWQPDGRLTLSFGLYNEGWREALCCECGEPVLWVLDMMSFQHNGRGGFDLGHAACLWTPEGFDRPRSRASQRAANGSKDASGGSR